MTSSTAGHTAGPWFYSQESIDPEWYIVTIKGGMIVANVNAHFHQEANARLIAEAPRLLDALIKLSNEVIGSLPLMEPMARRELGNTNYTIMMQRAEEARTLIASATGVA